MRAEALIVGPGDRFVAWGRLLRTSGGGVWFGPDLSSDGDSGPWVVPPPLSVPAEGVNFDVVTRRSRRGGNEEGYAELVGTWQSDRVRVEKQSLVRTSAHTNPMRLPLDAASPSEAHAAASEIVTVLRSNADRWGLFSYPSGPSNSMAVGLVRVTREIAAWANGTPAGLIILKPWLEPA